MDFELKDVMEAVGPSAALAFAAWLFLQLLQQRYTSAYTRYRDLVDAFRTGVDGKRREVIKSEIKIYRKRVLYMLYATNIGLVGAILLLLALISSGLNAVFKFDWLKYIGATGIVVGLTIVAICCVIVIVENSLIKGPIEAELHDLEGLND
jgi:uncharacterized membrane protein